MRSTGTRGLLLNGANQWHGHSGMGETVPLERMAILILWAWVQKSPLTYCEQQENAEDEKQSSDLQKLMTVHFAVRKLGYLFRWAVSPSTDILQCTSESQGIGRRTASRQRETGSETASDRLLASNREKQKRNTCSAAAFQTVHYKSCCFLQVLVFLFSQGKEIKKNMERIMCKLWPCRELKAPLCTYQLT